MDAGAQSPRETWLRLLLIDAGLPPPRTQIRVSDVHDIGRAELVDRQGWIDLRVIAEHSRRFILHRVH